MKKLLFVLLLSISSVVQAQWTLVEFHDTAHFYIESTTIQTINKNKRAWLKMEFSKSELQKSARSLIEFDCLEKKLRFLNFESFNKSNLIESKSYTNQPQEWEYVAPGSAFSSILNYVCKTK